jgi:hypothetical protein
MAQIASLVLAALALSLASCTAPATPALEVLPVTRQITTSAMLAEALASRKAVIHVDVDWSITSVQSRQVIEEFRTLALSDRTLDAVTYYRIDCTEPVGEMASIHRDWILQRDQIKHGNGALVWVRDGVEVDQIGHAAQLSADELLERTRSALASGR